MQLANPQEVSEQQTPPIRAALIDSLFETAGTVHVGIVFATITAAMTALRTGSDLIWACVALLALAGIVRAIDLHLYQARKSTLTADGAARWQTRYQIGAMIQAVAIGIWCSTTLLSTDDAVAHMRTISYGKERPVAVCNDISCWSQNRRAVTVLNAGA